MNFALALLDQRILIHPAAKSCIPIRLKRNASDTFPTPIQESSGYEDFVKHIELLESTNERLQSENTALLRDRHSLYDTVIPLKETFRGMQHESSKSPKSRDVDEHLAPAL